MNKGWKGLFLGTGFFLTLISLTMIVFFIIQSPNSSLSLPDLRLAIKSLATAAVMILAALL